ncbi:MAG: hypothetical protein K0S47_2569 [Herbinix sp.]|jgi:hypothetical protein|nr:hypothetical protein [Herbinix sp.]
MQMENGEEMIWKIREMEELTDTFRTPMPSKNFSVIEHIVEGWPSFHVSPADPDGQYKSFEYSINFELKNTSAMYLYMAYIVSTPRFPDVIIDVNGIQGMYYPNPVPSKEKEIKPAHALHASIYNREDSWTYIPEQYLRLGNNVITIIAQDDKPVERIENEQAVLRLDRMADACGFHYGALELRSTTEKPEACVHKILPSVIYYHDESGNLVEKCSLRIQNINSRDEMLQGSMHFSWDNGEMTIPYSVPTPPFGQVRIPFCLPDGEGIVRYEMNGDLKLRGTFQRKRKWKVYTTPHAHTDIGYTHRQWEVAERMCRNIDTALDLLKGEYKENFAYIIDVTWHLEEYLNSRSMDRKEELMEAIASGKFGIPWNYADLLTQLPSLEALIHNGDFTNRILELYGLFADRSDIVDVASATGSYPSVLAGSGVKYLLHADNQDRGPFRFNGELHRHSPFWWKSPDGSRILTWLARMYCELKKVCGSPASYEAAERGLELWLMDYERDDYAPDAVILYGQEADNTDLDTRSAKFLSEWKEKVVYPELIPSNGSSFFDYIMKFSNSFDEYEGDEGAYWEDGAASSVKETFAVRNAEEGIRCAEILDSLAMLHSTNLKFPLEHYNEAWKQVLLYEEHTWGAFLSGNDPKAILQQDQWAVKKHMADQAVHWKNRLLIQATAKISLMWNNGAREVVVYNPYSFPVWGMVTVEFSIDETIINPDGSETTWVEISRTTTQVLAGIWVDSLNSFSYRRYVLRKRKPMDQGGRKISNIVDKELVEIENNYYKASINTVTGCVQSLYDKELQKELTQGNTLGQILYAKGGEGTTLLGNRPELKKTGAKVQPCFFPSETILTELELGTCVKIKGTAVLGAITVTYTLPKKEKSLWMEYCYDKEETDQLEAVYVDFPFDLPTLSNVLSDSQIGWVDWYKKTLPGACKEWMPLQTSILMQSNECDIQIASPDAFLFTVGSPVQGKWSSEIETRGNRIFSYVMNNYWRVNYLGKQGGQICFRYGITSESSIPYEKAYRFGILKRQGIIAHRMSYQEFRTEIPKIYQEGMEAQLFFADSDHIVVSTIRGSRNGMGLIIRLQETGGYEGDITLHFPYNRLDTVERTNHQERCNEKLSNTLEDGFTVTLKPWEVHTYQVTFAKDNVW